MITKNKEATLEQIVNVINSNKTFSIYVHINVDFDAIGSSLALKRVLEKMGKTAHVFVDSVLPLNAKMFLDVEKINNEKLKEYDACIILDSSDENRLGRLKYKYRKNVKTSILIDHHIGSELFARNCYSNSEVSSTCEIIYNLIKMLNIDIDEEISKLLISGIYTDTGSLKFSNTKPSTFKALTELLEKSGKFMDEITYPIFNSLSKQAFDLRKLANDKVKFFDNDTFAITILTAKDFKSVGATMEDTEGVVDLPMQIESVKVNVLMSEDSSEENVFRISIRSKGNISARNIALEFGGGGHQKASGCKVSDSAENIEKKMIDAIRKEMKEC